MNLRASLALAAALWLGGPVLAQQVQGPVLPVNPGINSPVNTLNFQGSGTAQPDGSIAVTGGGSQAYNGTITHRSASDVFAGSDGTTQLTIGNTGSAANYFNAIGGIAGVGPSFVVTGSDTNIAANITAKGTGNVNLSNGSGVLAQGVDPGGAVSSNGQVQLTPSISNGTSKVGNATYGVNLDCGTGGVACNEAGTPIMGLGQLYSFNTNGDFQIDQPHEGASFTPTNGGRVTDGWFSTLSQASKLTTQRSTSKLTQLTASSLLITSSSAYSVGSGENFALFQRILGTEMGNLGWGTSVAQAATLDVCMKATGITFPANIPMVLNNANTGGSYRSFVHNVPLASSGTVVCQSIAVPADTNSGSWLNATAAQTALVLYIGLGAGSTFQSATLDAWQTGQFYGSAASTPFVSTNAATITITNIHLRAGTLNPTLNPWQPMPYAFEYFRARQRYWKSFAAGTAPAQNVGAGTGEIQFPAIITTTGTERSQSLLIPMLGIVSASVTFYNPSAANGACRDETAAGDGGTPTAGNMGVNGFSISCTGNASTAVGNLMGVHVVFDTLM